MDEFTTRLDVIDKEKLKLYLQTLELPCYESTLLKVVFPDMNILIAHPLALYQNHFLLFHLLYRLQDEFYKDNQYLFVHFMRTFLLNYPEQGTCRFYEEAGGTFCAASCDQNKNYCSFHHEKIGDDALEQLSTKYFYLDPKNYYNLNEDTAVSFIKGTWEILNNYSAYTHSFAIMGIPETSDINLIKQKFKSLAKQFHPDHGELSQEKFIEINNAYRLLLQLIPIFSNQTDS